MYGEGEEEREKNCRKKNSSFSFPQYLSYFCFFVAVTKLLKAE